MREEAPSRKRSAGVWCSPGTSPFKSARAAAAIVMATTPTARWPGAPRTGKHWTLRAASRRRARVLAEISRVLPIRDDCRYRVHACGPADIVPPAPYGLLRHRVTAARVPICFPTPAPAARETSEHPAGRQSADLCSSSYTGPGIRSRRTVHIPGPPGRPRARASVAQAEAGVPCEVEACPPRTASRQTAAGRSGRCLQFPAEVVPITHRRISFGYGRLPLRTIAELCTIQSVGIAEALLRLRQSTEEPQAPES